jgi:hypothetical protein
MKRFLLLAGALGALAYLSHVVIGGFLWQGYNHLMQPISDLTATGAPDRHALGIILYAYSLFSIVFGIAGLVHFHGLKMKTAQWGMILFVAMQCVSLLYGFFPEDLPGGSLTFLGAMHIVVTALIVPFTIGSPLVTGLGLRKEQALRRLATFSIVCAVIIFFAGGTSAVFFAKRLSFFGLVERINIGTLQTWMFVTSVVLYRNAARTEA